MNRDPAHLQEPPRLRDLTAEIEAQPRGTSFARYCKALLMAKGHTEMARRYAEHHFNVATPSVARALRLDTKAAVAAGTTSDWPAALSDFGGLVTQFLAALTPRTIVGRVPGLVRVPFNRRFVMQTDTASGEWTGEGLPIPMAELDFTFNQLHPTKVAIITAVSNEIMRFEGPASDAFMLNALLRTNARTLDASFIDPANAGSTEVEPAAVTYNAPQLASTGSTVTAITSDANSAGRMLADLGSDLATVAWVMHPRTAEYLSTLPGSGGSPAFPSMADGRGIWARHPVITSTAVPLVGSPATTTIALVDGSRILVADDGQIEVDASQNAALQMRTDPVTGATNVVSMFQTDCTALKSVRVINWSAQTGAAAVITGITF